jgi:hypothetical protein
MLSDDEESESIVRGTAPDASLLFSGTCCGIWSGVEEIWAMSGVACGTTILYPTVCGVLEDEAT